MTSPQEARQAKDHRRAIERAADLRYKESGRIRRAGFRRVKELEAEVDAYAKARGMDTVDHMELWDACRLVFLKVIGLDRRSASEAHATARVLFEEHPI